MELLEVRRNAHRIERNAVVCKSQISVCDITPFIFPRGQNGVYMVIGFYADDSTDQPKHYMQTAGAIFGWPANFTEAERLWNQHLDKAGIDYFKASECEMLNGQFDPVRLGMNLNSARALADSTRRDLVSVIEKINLSAVAVSMVLGDFRDVVAVNPKARYYYGTDSTILTYGRLIKMTIDLIHQDHPELLKYRMAFTFDAHAEYLKAEAAYRNLQKKDSACADMMGYVGHADDKDHAPLQMADLMAHEARHKSTQILADSDRERPAFRILSKVDAFYAIGIIGKEGLLRELDNYPDPPADGSSNRFRWVLD